MPITIPYGDPAVLMSMAQAGGQAAANERRMAEQRRMQLAYDQMRQERAMRQQALWANLWDSERQRQAAAQMQQMNLGSNLWDSEQQRQAAAARQQAAFEAQIRSQETAYEGQKGVMKYEAGLAQEAQLRAEKQMTLQGEDIANYLKGVVADTEASFADAPLTQDALSHWLAWKNKLTNLEKLRATGGGFRTPAQGYALYENLRKELESLPLNRVPKTDPVAEFGKATALWDPINSRILSHAEGAGQGQLIPVQPAADGKGWEAVPGMPRIEKEKVEPEKPNYEYQKLQIDRRAQASKEAADMYPPDTFGNVNVQARQRYIQNIMGAYATQDGIMAQDRAAAAGAPSAPQAPPAPGPQGDPGDIPPFPGKDMADVNKVYLLELPNGNKIPIIFDPKSGRWKDASGAIK